MKDRILHVVGARPNFMKAAPVWGSLRGFPVKQQLVHTGQHYDQQLSQIFFDELGLPDPHLNLGIGSGSHGFQTGRLIIALEEAFKELKPHLILVYGDVNSTLAASVAASKLLVPVAHVEAGLRSFDRTMPEEINRVVTDSLADLLFTTSPEAGAHLANEGRPPSTIHFVGNTMIDTLLLLLPKMDSTRPRESLGLRGDFGIVTLHRPSNVDDEGQTEKLVKALGDLSEMLPLALPLHPRGRERLTAAGLSGFKDVRVTEPLGYLDFVSLVKDARIAVTDSGGVQEETTMLRVPCLTLRPNTERPITISHGTNRLSTPETLTDDAARALAADWAQCSQPPFWDGRAATRIARVVGEFITHQ